MQATRCNTASVRNLSPLGLGRKSDLSPGQPQKSRTEDAYIPSDSQETSRMLPLLALALGGTALLAGCGQPPSPPPPQVQTQTTPVETPVQVQSPEALKTREEVMLRLHQMEGNQSDAVANFRTIENNLRPQEDFGEAAQSFVRILETYGRGNTGQVQSAYRTVSAGLQENESRDQAVDALLKIYRVEGSFSDTHANYRLIQTRVDKGADRTEQTDQFLRLLQQVGRGNTSQAQQMYRVLNPQ